jgi:hypothetical protein
MRYDSMCFAAWIPRHWAFHIALLVAFSALHSTPSAAYSVFTDRGAWEAAIAGATRVTDPFDANIAGGPQITFDSGVVSTNAGGRLYTFDNSVSFGAYANGLDAQGLYGAISNTWAFSEPIVGFGADWSAVLSYTGFTVIGDFDGTGSQGLDLSALIGGRSGPQFVGIVGLSEFDEVRFVSSETQNYAADRLAFAVARAPIPEPTAVLCFAVGFVVLGAALRRPRVTID